MSRNARTRRRIAPFPTGRAGTPTNTRYYFFDQLGSVMGLIDKNSEQVVQRYSYSPYG